MNWRHKTNLYTFSWRFLWLPAVLRINLDKSYTWYKEDPLKPTRNNQNHHFLEHREGQHSLLQVKFHIKELSEGEKDRFVVCTEHGYQANFLLQRLQQLLYQWMPALSSHSTCSFSDCTSTEAAIYRMLSCFHPFAFISRHNLSQGMPSARYTDKSSSSTSSQTEVRCSFFYFTEVLHSDFKCPQTALPVSGTSEADTGWKARPSVLNVPIYGHEYVLGPRGPQCHATVSAPLQASARVHLTIREVLKYKLALPFPPLFLFFSSFPLFKWTELQLYLQAPWQLPQLPGCRRRKELVSKRLWNHRLCPCSLLPFAYFMFSPELTAAGRPTLPPHSPQVKVYCSRAIKTEQWCTHWKLF